MKIVYFVQSHDAIDHLRHLIARLRAPEQGSLVVIGHDGSRKPLERSELPPGEDTVLRQRREPVRRGELSCLEPYLEAATWLLDRAMDFDWLIYLSGRDYPVRPLTEIRRTLAETKEDGFLRSFDLQSPESPWGRRRAHRRYDFRYRRLPEVWRWPLKLAKPLLRLAGCELSLTYGVHFGVPARPLLFGEEFRGYGGWQWHSLRRRAVEYLVDFCRRRPEIVEAFRHTLVPDEALVQTVLLNAPGFRFRKESRRYADTHERPGGHSRLLTIDDFAELTNGDYDFARRFDPLASRLLLERLDREVHGIEGERP